MTRPGGPDALGAAETDFQAVHEFYMAGVLSAEEFEKAKSRLLGE